MKKTVLVVIPITALALTLYAYRLRSATPETTVTTQPLSRGDIVINVEATGTLQAVETVQVGTQVSGVVSGLYADFNSIVRKGQVIARLDPQLIQTQIEQQQANVARAEADLERIQVGVADARHKLARAGQLAEKNLLPRSELETAQVNVASAEAQVRASQASLTQARAQLNNSRVNLKYTTITSPIDGIVISRNVDAGQTVAASMNAPTLFVLAADLTRMEVVANVDESDVGRMRPGQPVTFRVDAYPTDAFSGVVSQVRLQPAVVQNVVTYATVITVPNPQLKLKPGMTANATIEVARKSDVLRVMNAATRFKPTREMFAALNQPVPQDLNRPRATSGTTADAASPAVAFKRVSATTTADSLFAPQKESETNGMAWVYTNRQLEPVRLRLGMSDGTYTEVLNEADIAPDARVATSVTTGQELKPAVRQTSPLIGAQPGGPGRR
jgi:HlyD family secretion protein